MNSEALADELLAADGPAALELLLAERRALLSLETVAVLKGRTDAEKLRDAGRALRIAGVAEAVARALGTPETLALALWASGNALYPLARFREALERYRRAQAIYAQQDAPLEVARLQINQVAVLHELAAYGEAAALAEQARATCAAIGPPAWRFQATLELNCGLGAEHAGDLPVALAAYGRGAELFGALGALVERAYLDLNRTHVLVQMDRFVEAEQLGRAARAVLAEHSLTQEVARADLNLGILAYRRGQHQAALAALEQAADGFAVLRDPARAAVVSLYRSFVYRDLNLLEETVVMAGQALRSFRRLGWQTQQALALINQGVAHQRLGQYDRAARRLDQARRLLGREGAALRVLEIDIRRARLALEAGAVERAGRIARRAEHGLDPAVWPGLAAELQLVLARCALRGGLPGVALERSATALTLAGQFQLRDLAVQAQHAHGQALEETGAPEAALRSYEQAVAGLEELRATLELDELRLTLADDKQPIYADAIRLRQRDGQPAAVLQLLNQACRAPLAAGAPQQTAGDADHQALHVRLHLLREEWHWHQSKLDTWGDPALPQGSGRETAAEAEQRRRLRSLELEIADLLRRLRVRRDERAPVVFDQTHVPADPAQFAAALVRALPVGAALVHYYLAGGQVQVALVDAGGVELFSNLAPADSIGRLLRAWRFQIAHAHAAADLRVAQPQTHLRRLYDLLAAPLERRLAGVERLDLVVPPEWNDLPFAALFDGRQHLAERFCLTYLSAPEALLAHHQDPSPDGTALIVGYSDGGRLPQTLDEARRVAALLPRERPTTLLLEGDATLERFREASQSSRLIHLATHGVFRPDNPLFSWVRLADSRLTVADLYALTLPGRPLVVLSACETGRGQPRGGGLLGIGRALLVAGADGLVLSQWRVADSATAQLMDDLYQGLADADAAMALSQAQRRAVARGVAAAHWSGFLLIRG
ncbi:MAG TPA: CHAT domain-containing protein [Roseiflexaceae bacterium]|nr:CHAT domain-containing protein [Roseiflexaceae bacterium]